MPISKNDFDKGRREDPIISRIEEFLKSNKETAFTEEDILRHLYRDHYAWPGDHIAFSSAMLILSYAGKIETRYVNVGVGNQIYFRAKQ